MKTWNGDAEVRVTRHGRVHYVPDDATWNADAYSIGKPDVAWRVLGWETEPTEDTEWDGLEERTGRVVCIMVGDDAPHLFDPSDLTPLDELDYCAECGQVGCSHDGRDRSEGGAQ